MTSCASLRSAGKASSAAVGTATINRKGRRRFTARTAARMSRPVAIPSSTRITILSSRKGGGAFLRYRSSRRKSSFVSAATTRSTSPSGTNALWIKLWSNSEMSGKAMAPIASSSCPGKPSLRTSTRSSGARKACAISKATGTPPRGKASTTTSSLFAHIASLFANRRPASWRS